MKNGDLREAMATKANLFTPKPSRDFRGAVRQAIEKGKGTAHEGDGMGRSTISEPTSSAVGRLSKCFAGRQNHLCHEGRYCYAARREDSKKHKIFMVGRFVCRPV